MHFPLQRDGTCYFQRGHYKNWTYCECAVNVPFILQRTGRQFADKPRSARFRILYFWTSWNSVIVRRGVFCFSRAPRFIENELQIPLFDVSHFLCRLLRT